MNVQIDPQRDGKGWVLTFTWGEYRGIYVPFLTNRVQTECRTEADVLDAIRRVVPHQVAKMGDRVSYEKPEDT